MSRNLPNKQIEKTICLIKPTAYHARESILQQLLAHEFQLIERKDVQINKAQATRLYVEHFGLSFFDALVESMTTGPVCVLLLQRVDAVAELRHLVGPTDPHMARQVDANCLRAIYGESSLKNGIHASKSPSEAEREEDALFLRKKRTLVLFGPPASGKGTQCDLIIAAYGLVHLSTGDLLRAHVKNGTEIGQEIKSYLDSGKLVPDALITRLTLERLAQPDCEERGFILDGFPRTPMQAQSLIDAGVAINRFVVIQADYDTLIKRVSGRRFDPKTGTTYHIEYNPPPKGIVADRCVIRSDDTEAVMRARLQTYDETVAGVVKQFHDVCLVKNESGMPGIYHVFAQVVRCIEKEGTRKNVGIRIKSANQKSRLTAKL